MKILFVSRFIPYTGGREIILQNLLHHLARQHEVILLTPDVGYFTNDFSIFNFKTKKQLQADIKKIKPDLINVHTFYFANDVVEVSKKLKIPLILTLHGVFLKHYDQKYCDNLIKIIKKVDLVTVVCDYHRKALIKAGINKKKIVLIRNGINIKKFKFVDYDYKKIRRIFNLPLDSKILLTSARLTPLKGLNFLISSLPYIRYSNFKLLISVPTGRYNIEEVKYRENLLKMAKKIGVSDKIIIQFHSNGAMPFLYKTSDIFILPSLMEGLPLSLLEAMVSKMPCIASGVGGINEIIVNKKNGYLITVKKYKELARVISKVLRSNNLLIKINAYKTVKNKFKEENMFNSYERLYKSII